MVQDSDFDVAFFEKYNLDTSEYENISVTTLSFSVRVINRFVQNGITTVAVLLRNTPSSLMQLKGFGKNCLDEVEAFCATLKEGDCVPVCASVYDKKASYNNTMTLFTEHRDDMAFGNFSVFDNIEMTEDEKLMLQKYQEAYNIIGEDMAFECVASKDKIVPVIEMLKEYHSQTRIYIEIWNLINALPKLRKGNKAYGYINAFTLDENERAVLKGLCESNESTLCSMINSNQINEPPIYLLLTRFLKWCAFDLEMEISDLFDKLYSNERIRTVTQLRARRQTLEQIGRTLGITRERVRQIETQIKRKFSRLHSRVRIISKISAEQNSETILSPTEIQKYCGEYTTDLLFLLQSYENSNYTYDQQLDAFIIGDDSISGRLQSSIDTMPEIIKSSHLEGTLKDVAEEIDVPIEMVKKAFLDAYRLTGDVYHRYRLSLAKIYERVLDKYYQDGFKAYDVDEICRFRQIIADEYGDVKLPVNDRALTSRVASICVLCGRGVYRLKRKEYLPRQLVNKIYDYIENSENTIFLTNTLFNVFEDELIQAGVDNKYYLQGILHELFADKFVFRRDYISKDANVTSVYSAVVNFIKKSIFPVSKMQIQEAFPGITEIVINLSVSDPEVLNYFGEYLHASRLNISTEEKTYLFNVIDKIISDGEAHHGREIYEAVSKQKPEILTRNAALYPFSAFSVMEFLFKDNFQFSRPYVAKFGVEIGRPAERLHDMIYAGDEFTVSDIGEFSRENHFQISSILEYINGCNDEFLLVDDNKMMRIDRVGIDETVAHCAEDVIFSAISKTTPVSSLTVWDKLPALKIPWTEWLVYSVIFKWGTKLVAATSSNQFRLSVPLVAPVDNYDPSAFRDIEKSVSAVSYMADDLSNMDLLLEEIMGDDFLDSF